MKVDVLRTVEFVTPFLAMEVGVFQGNNVKKEVKGSCANVKLQLVEQIFGFFGEVSSWFESVV